MSAVEGTWVELTAADGHRLRSWTARPAGVAKGHVLILPEIFGINSHIRAVTDSYAADGYVAIAPDLFQRIEAGFEVGYTTEQMERGRAIMQQITIENALADSLAALDYLGGAETAAVVGYCWGGTLAWAAASRFPVKAAACYYGGGIARLMDQPPRAPTITHFGAEDHAIPLTVAEAVRKNHPAVITHIYPAGHGFNCDLRASFHGPSSALAKRRTLALLDAVF